jgi:hypothetical protein
MDKELPIKLSQEVSEFMEANRSCMYDAIDGNNCYFIPIWFEKVGENLYKQHYLNNLPTQLANRIKEERNG